MLSYTVNRPTAILPANRRPGERRDSVVTDTMTPVPAVAPAAEPAPEATPAPSTQQRRPRATRRPGVRPVNPQGSIDLQKAEKATLEPVKEKK